jgi:septal ring factor EnvC (AmiA/AmiB activator)
LNQALANINKLNQEIKILNKAWEEKLEKADTKYEELKKSFSNQKQTESALNEQIQSMKRKLQVVNKNLSSIEDVLKMENVFASNTK